jgi:hypothetical protein
MDRVIQYAIERGSTAQAGQLGNHIASSARPWYSGLTVIDLYGKRTMPLFEIDWHSFTGYSGVPTTLEIDTVPAQIGVQAWLNGVDGGGLVFVGIDSYRRRLSSGADQPIEFNALFNDPPVIVDFISSVTFAFSLGDNQQGWMVGRLDYWE